MPLGELLRKSLEYKDEILEYMRAGKIIPSYITITVLKKVLDGCRDDDNILLIDGFPRSWENVYAWNIEVDIDIKGIIYLDCPESICLQRVLMRRRMDDNENCVRKRFLSFRKETAPIINYYKEQNKMVYTVDATLPCKNIVNTITELVTL